MNITLKNEDTKRIINMYYTDVKGMNVDVRVNTSSISVVSKVEFAGKQFNSEEKLSNADLCEIVNYFLGDEYELKSVHLQKICTSYSPYGETYGLGGLSIYFDKAQQKVRTLTK